MTETSPPTTREEQAFCPQRADIVYRRWRRGYIFAMSCSCMLLSSIIVFGGYDTEVAKIFLRGLIEITSTVAIVYVGAGVLDRSQILSKIGDGMSRRYERTETIVETPRSAQRRVVETQQQSTPVRQRPPQDMHSERGPDD